MHGINKRLCRRQARWRSFKRAFRPRTSSHEPWPTGRLTRNLARIVDGALTCSCVQASSVAIGDYANGVLEDVSYVRDGIGLRAKSAVWVDGVWALEEFEVQIADRVVRAASAQLSESGHALVDVTWHATSAHLDESPQCDGPPTIVDATLATARIATFSDERWRMRGFRAAPWPVPAARSTTRAAPGVLPPIARATKESQHAEVGATLWGPLLATGAGGANVPTELGVGLVSRDRRVLRAMLALESDGAVEPELVGNFAIGSDSHVIGRLEHPMSNRVWALRRLTDGGIFRDWQATRVGAGTFGRSGALQLDGAILTDPQTTDEKAEVGIVYGAGFMVGDYTHWTVDVAHRTEVDVGRHSTTVGVGARVPIGRTEAYWVTPALELLANYSTVAARRGFDASTSLSALASAEAGLAFAGVWRRARHRLAPIIRAGAEVAGVTQRQVREGAPEYPYQRPDRWRWASAVLEQSFRDSSIRIDLPVGLYVDSMADEPTEAVATFAQASLSMSAARLEFAGVCESGCEDTALHLGGYVSPRRGLTLRYAVSNLDPRTSSLVLADRRLTRAFTAVNVLHPSVPGERVHRAGLTITRGPGFADLEGHYAADPRARGAYAEIGWNWAALGWGLSVGGAWLPELDEWGVHAGLSIR